MSREVVAVSRGGAISRAASSVVACIAMLAGCGSGGGPSSLDAATAIDASGDGPICDLERPRATAPTVSVGPSGLENRVVAAIDGATVSIDVQMYSFTVTRIADRLIAADRRGAPVRVILDGNQTENATMRSRLSAGGVEVHTAPAGFPNAHAKYMVIDHNRIFLESGNFTQAGMVDQRNYAVDDRDPEDVADLATIFAADVAGQAPTLSCSRLVVTPGDSRTRVLRLIGDAQTRLDVALYYLSDSAVRAAIIGAKNRGVPVRVMLSDISEISENAATATTLKSAGIAVKTLANPVLHAKIIIADDAVLVGSNNMSLTSLQDNREVGLIMHDASSLAPVSTQFNSDWAAATAW
jgi:cardiolipin synthase A/B